MEKKITQADVEKDLMQVRLFPSWTKDKVDLAQKHILWEHFLIERAEARKNNTEISKEVPEALKRAKDNLIKNMDSVSLLAEFRMTPDGGFDFVRLVDEVDRKNSPK